MRNLVRSPPRGAILTSFWLPCGTTFGALGREFSSPLFHAVFGSIFDGFRTEMGAPRARRQQGCGTWWGAGNNAFAPPQAWFYDVFMQFLHKGLSEALRE